MYGSATATPLLPAFAVNYFSLLFHVYHSVNGIYQEACDANFRAETIGSPGRVLMH